jgi:Protein of unknown function (DUF1573)
MNRSILLPALWLLATAAIAQQQKTVSPTGAHITFASLVHDYGTIAQGSNGNCEFAYTNTGDQPLILSMCQSSCGCVVPSCDREPLAPHQSAVVRVKYDTNRAGPFTKTVTVTSNAANSPVVLLRIKGTVVPTDTAAAPLTPPYLAKP